MPDTDPILKAITALRSDGVEVESVGEELEQWQIGAFTYSDAEIWRLAASRGLVED
jgi:outer membrane receptor for ferric coprogen and ferric-rhodotorulic acid